MGCRASGAEIAVAGAWKVPENIFTSLPLRALRAGNFEYI
jgi:hypothetical protein